MNLKENIDNTAHVKCCLSRKDVVIKSILRSMRKYYSDLLQDNTEFTRKQRNIKIKHKRLVSGAIQIAETLGYSSNKYVVAFYLASVSFPQDFRKCLYNALKKNKAMADLILEAIDTINKIEITLTKFSKKVMDDFAELPEACLLLSHYLDRVNNPNYKGYFRILKNLAEAGINMREIRAREGEERFESKVMQLIR